MLRNPRGFRAVAALALAVVLNVLAIGVPLLDQGTTPVDLSFSTTPENHGTLTHDHGICVQFGTSAWSMAVPATALTVGVVAVVIPARATHLRPELLSFSTHRPRAPPAV